MIFDIKNFEKLLNINNMSGHVYGSDTISMLLYTLIKREKLENVVELGTGLGTTSLWICQALMENNKGSLTTVDSGRDVKVLLPVINEISEYLQIKKPDFDESNYIDYYTWFLEMLMKTFKVDYHFNFKNIELDMQSSTALQDIGFLSNGPIDMLFADFAHGPDNIIDIFRSFLPMMNEYSYIFIDSAPTKLRSYLTLEKLVDDLNNGKVSPRLLNKSHEQNQQFMQVVAQRRFRLVHLTEKEKQSQNSTAWIIIEPIEYRPNPEVLTLP